MLNRGARSRQEPRIVEKPARKMAVVYTVGDPNHIDPRFMSALYGAVYKLKFDLKKQGREFEVEPLRARWPDAHLVPKDRWQAIWGIPVPDDTSTLVQKVPGVEVKIEEWEYGEVAETLHLGPFSAERPTIDRLYSFIAASGYEIAGIHEEEYLTRPTAAVLKTIIRYPVRKVQAQVPVPGMQPELEPVGSH